MGMSVNGHYYWQFIQFAWARQMSYDVCVSHLESTWFESQMGTINNTDRSFKQFYSNPIPTILELNQDLHSETQETNYISYGKTI
jgi:hypothetical protein